jgi:hypothetical protein
MSLLANSFPDHQERLNGAQIKRLMICFGISVLPHLTHVPFWVVLAAAGMCYWRYRVDVQALPLPSVSARLLMAAILLGGVQAELGTLAGRDAGTALMVGLVGIKFLEVRNVRDYMVVAFVLYFLSMIALLFEQSMPVFAYVLIAITLITGALMQRHFAEREKLPRWAMLRMASFMVLQALPLAIILFLAFPRIQGKFGFNLGLAKTGLPNRIQPGSIASLANDGSMAFRVDFPDGDEPPPSELYWRSLTLSEFNSASHEWTAGQSSGDNEVLTGGRQILQRITLPAHGEKWLFALEYPVGTPDPDWLGVIRRNGGHVLEANRTVNRKIQYTIASMWGGNLRLAKQKEGDTREAAELMPEMLRLRYTDTTLNPKVVALAKSFREGAADDHEVMERALKYFRKEGFTYTLAPGRYEGDSTYQFLFAGKQGFCEHFASSFAVLMRLAGVPTRVVIGYQGGEFNPYGRFYVVRQSDAHAWNEVYFKGRGWVRVDPTLAVSPARIIQGAQIMREQQQDSGLTVAGVQVLNNDWKPFWLDALLDEMSLRWQQAEEVWDRWILSYNSDSQLQMLGRLGFTDYSWDGFLIVAFLGLLLTGFLILLTMRRSDRIRDPIELLWSDYLHLLDIAGVQRQTWEGPMTFAQRAALLLPWAREPIQEFARVYTRARYGRGAGQPSHVLVLKDALRTLRQDLREGLRKQGPVSQDTPIEA